MVLFIHVTVKKTQYLLIVATRNNGTRRKDERKRFCKYTKAFIIIILVYGQKDYEFNNNKKYHQHKYTTSIIIQICYIYNKK